MGTASPHRLMEATLQSRFLNDASHEPVTVVTEGKFISPIEVTNGDGEERWQRRIVRSFRRL